MRVEVPARNWVLPSRPRKELVTNSWEGLCDGIAGADSLGTIGSSPFAAFPGNTTTISSPGPFNANLSTALMTQQLMSLSFGYANYGVVQTLIDEPVDDAFKGGLIIKSSQMDDKDISLLHKSMKKNRDIHSMKQGFKWGRLFGGAGLIIATEQDPMEPLDIDSIKPDQPLSFLPADRWELMVSQLDTRGYAEPRPYQYYGETIDWSRVIRIKGREAPARIRSLLQGWGMSELERCMRDINTFYKLQTVIFELVDEAKVDVYKLAELNNNLGSASGTQAAIMRIMFANWIKNYKSALVLDKDDEYDQKTQQFSGLGDLYEQARINLSGATRMPVNKLFGLAATGFASGEDSMENYNALVESDIREPAGPLVDDVIGLRCKQLFGDIPEFTVEFKPLRIVDPTAEEAIKTSKQARIMALRQADQITGQEADELLHLEGLLDIETEVGKGLRDPAPGADEPQPEPGEGEKKGPTKNALERRKYDWIRQQARRGRGFKGWDSRQVDRGSIAA